MGQQEIKEIVKEKYAEAARRVAGGGKACCGGAAETGHDDPITSNLYSENETAGLPEEAVTASLGCGNPSPLAQLLPGETAFDLASGGGIDVLLSARKVGPTGKASGRDMTAEILPLARENHRRRTIANVEFL